MRYPPSGSLEPQSRDRSRARNPVSRSHRGRGFHCVRRRGSTSAGSVRDCYVDWCIRGPARPCDARRAGRSLLLTTGAPEGREAPWRFKLQMAIVLFISILGTGAGLVLIYFDFHNNAELKAYQAAALCTAPTDALSGESCRYRGAATVTGSTGQPVISIDVTFSDLPGRPFTSKFSDLDEPNPATVVTGATESAELWNARLTGFADVTTRANPKKLPLDLATTGCVIALSTLFLASLS